MNMIRKITFILVLGSLGQIFAQTTVTFRVNLKSMVANRLFKPAQGERLVVRGNFNDWKGYDCELLQTGSGLFAGTFFLDNRIGDTLEYKYVIRNSRGKDYWEVNPEPENSNNGNRRFVISNSIHELPVTEFVYDEYIRYPVIFPSEKLQADFLQMREAIEESHPALYDYTEKRTLDSLFDYYFHLIDREMEFSEFYRLLPPVISRIGCGHTKLWIPEAFWNAAPDRLFPLKIVHSGQKVLVAGYYRNLPSVPIGSEIRSVNGIPINRIIDILKAVSSSDGFIESFKSATVHKNFSDLYALYYGFPDTFHMEFIAPGTVEIRRAELIPATIDAVHSGQAVDPELSLKLLANNTVALLTINTFGYYDRVQYFRNFIDSTFEVIQRNSIQNLIMDLRGNGGGDPFCSSYLFAYLEKEPVPYFAESYGRYDSLALPVPMADKNYRGNLYTLIDGSCFSTTGHFTALLKYHRIGKFVGSETGATFTCTGSVRYLDLKNTRLILGTARKRRYSAAVMDMDIHRGILPDYDMEQSQTDLMNGRDTVLNFVLDLIENRQKQ